MTSKLLEQDEIIFEFGTSELSEVLVNGKDAGEEMESLLEEDFDFER